MRWKYIATTSVILLLNDIARLPFSGTLSSKVQQITFIAFFVLINLNGF